VETFGAEQFFAVQFAIGFPKLGVPLVGHLAERVVMHGWAEFAANVTSGSGQLQLAVTVD
jgi:hypothetical protein